MNKLLFFIFFLLSVVLKGQDLSIGIMGGTTFSAVHKTEPNEGMTIHKDKHSSFTFGANSELQLYKGFFGVLEANYEKKGFAEHYFTSFSSIAVPPDELAKRVDERQSFSYLSFPVLLRHKWGNNIKVFGSIGFSPSLLIGAEEVNSDYDSGDILAYNTKDIDVSGILEAGMEWEVFSNISLCGGLRYNKSFSYYNKYPRSIDGGEVSHKAITVYGVIKYHIK